MRETQVQSLGWEDLEKEMATHSSILAWKIPWTEEPCRLHSPWGRKESDTLSDFTFTFIRKSSCSSFKSNLAELYDEEEQEWVWNPNFIISYSKDNVNKTLTNLSVALEVKNLPANAGDVRNRVSIPELGRSPGGGHGNPLQYSCWRIPLAVQRSLVGYIPQDCTELDTT